MQSEFDLDLFQLQIETTREVNRVVGGVLSAGRTSATALRVTAVVHECYEIKSQQARALSAAKPPACRSGCSWCCYQPVRVLVPEAIAIASYVMKELSAAMDIGPVMARAEAVAKQRRGASLSQRGVSGVACPLLESGVCLAYEVRPLFCRKVLSASADLCKLAHEAPTRSPGIPLDSRTMAVGTGAFLGFAEALERDRLEAGPVELAAGLTRAMEANLVSERWIKGKQLFASIWWRDER